MRNLVVFLLLTFTITAYAQMGSINKEISQAMMKDGITQKEFVVGIGTVLKHLPNAKQLAREDALTDVYFQVAENVRAILHATNDEPFHEDVSEHYSTVAQMPIVPITLPRLVRVRLDRSTDDKHVYAVVAFNRQAVIDLYTQKADRLRKEINKTLAEGLGLGGDPADAAEQYLGTYRRYEELKEAELIIVGAAYKPNAKEGFEKLLNYMETEGSQEETIDFLDTYFQNVSPLAINHSNAVAEAITMQFEMQGAASPMTKVQLDEFTYGATEVLTGIAPILVKAMERRMMGKWTPLLKTTLKHKNRFGLGSNVDARLIGTYWERGNKITIRTTLRDAKTGEFQAVAILRFNKNALTNINPTRYKPGNYEYLVRNQKITAQGKLGGNRRSGSMHAGGGPVPSTIPTGGPTTPTPTGGPTTPIIPTGGSTPSETTLPVVYNNAFRLHVETNKGPGSQTYMIGERMRLYINVNQPAYIRVLYQQEGRWSQLAEDQEIKPEQVSQLLEVRGNFVCVEPEGIGQVLVLAKTTPFKPLTEVYYEDGHRYIGKPLAPAGTITPEQRDAETVEVQYLLRSFNNEDFSENIAAANPENFALKSFVDRSRQAPVPTNTTATLVTDAAEGNHVGTAIASLYLTTVRAE